MDAYRLVRSRRRTLALEITREGEVVVRAPMGLSQNRIDQFVADHRGWIAEHLERQRRRQAARPEPTEEERSEYIRRAREELPGRVAHYGALMGLTPAGLTVTGARTRFGSCSGKNRICFSWRLMQYPQAAIDYVVVHELCHLLERGHGPRFHALMDHFMPDWKARRAKLR